MADITKVNEQAAAWERNLSFLHDGGFGDVSNARTLLYYWMAQERDGYPGARENVRYFKEILGVCDESYK